MKKKWNKPIMKVIPCEIEKIQKDVKNISDEELKEELKKCGYYLEQKYKRNPEFVFRRVAEEWLLVPTGTAAVKFNGIASLNETGVFLWEMLEEERTVNEMGMRLAGKYQLTEQQGREDVIDFLNAAMGRDLVLRC